VGVRVLRHTLSDDHSHYEFQSLLDAVGGGGEGEDNT